MAYTTTAELRIAAGGTSALQEISDTENAATLALAQATVDGEIDSYARRLHGVSLPFSPVPDAIRGMAARETVRVLRTFKRVPTDQDQEHRRIFEAWLAALAAGNVIPPADDTYPIGDGGGAPVSGTRTLSSDDRAAGQNDRCSLKGLW